MYQTKYKVIYSGNGEYSVVNTDIMVIQSSWTNKINAIRTCKDLNKLYRSK